METLADDLILLSIRSNGVIGTSEKLRFGLSGSELVRLAALRRVDIDRGQIIILDEAPTGDVLLDEALKSMEAGLRPQTAKEWVAGQNKDLTRRYLERLVSAGTIRAESRKVLGFVPVTGWTVLDAGRLADARARLDAIAHGAGGVDSDQAALAGLASVIGLPSLLYPGFAGRAARKRIATASRRTGAPAAQDTATQDTATQDTAAAVDAAARAATDAAVRASIDAATHAAVSAATEAAHHAASDAGHAGAGHH